ncbi:MAG: hypothetical protein RL398_2218 [Planctomycetota bacterium]|jgi:hypothetical protein
MPAIAACSFVFAASAVLAAAPQDPIQAPPSAGCERVLQPEDLAGRKLAAKDLLAVLRTKPELPVAVAWTAGAAVALAQGSAARNELTVAMRRANLSDGGEDARVRLFTDVADVVESLTFQPRMEAELPVGFPGPQAVGEIELREYPAYRMARTAMRGGGSMGAFWPLFRHIESNGIAMTTPVQMDWNDDPERPRPVNMAFLYGAPGITPGKVDKGVEVVEVPAATALSIGAIGDDRRDRVEAMGARLQAWLAAPDCRYEAAGPLRTMGYNSPMVPRDQRYFEVQLPIRTKQASAKSDG